MLTNLLLGMIVTGGILYGLRLMNKLDDWRMEERELKKEEEAKHRTAVVFGMEENKALTTNLNQGQYYCLSKHRPVLKGICNNKSRHTGC